MKKIAITLAVSALLNGVAFAQSNDHREEDVKDNDDAEHQGPAHKLRVLWCFHMGEIIP